MLRPYLECSHFKIWTDHQEQRWILDLKESTGRLARWQLQLLEFDFEVIHIMCMCHLAADVMLHLPKRKSMEEDQVEDDILTLNVQSSDEKNLPVVCTLTNLELPMASEAKFL